MNLNHLQERFSKLHIGVLGDVMLDMYYKGAVSRISPEAPVPVVHIKSTEYKLGGAANVAANVASLGAECTLFGVIGSDLHGEMIQRELFKKHIISELAIQEGLSTTTKCRVVGENQQITRLDFEESLMLDHFVENILLGNLKRNIAQLNILILSDYNKGLLSELFCTKVIEIAKKENVRVVVDPKSETWDKYLGADWITPNFKEFELMFEESFENSSENIEKWAPDLLQKYNFKNLLITRSQKGMSLLSNGEFFHQETTAREVFDVSGAGDTVVATLALALAAQFDAKESLILANFAAGVVVGKFGTATVTVDELFLAYSQVGGSKYYPVQTLALVVQKMQSLGKKVVFTNGCFDILHRGHLMYMQEAKSLGDVLIVALNSDRSVKKLKGESRPINHETDRVFMMSSLSFVDYVLVFDEDTPEAILKLLKPDILVKGGDYTVEQIVGREYAKEARILPFVEGFSTTGLIKKMSD